MLAAPLLKWVGGKTKLLPELRTRLPPTYNRYFEPFVGGAALFFSIAPEAAVLGDMNAHLISTYRGVALHVDSVIESLHEHRDGHRQPDFYYEMRELFNNGQWSQDDAGTAAAFIYLNKTCFNGLWRVNRKGAFNVPKGDYKNPTIFNEDALRAAAKVLRKAELHVDGYETVSVEAVSGDFVYFDPPYDPHSATSNFTSYTKDTFGKVQQKQLADHAAMLADRGVHVMLSNNDTPYVRSLYPNFFIDSVQCGRSINSNGDKRGKVAEVIITSYTVTS